MVLPAMELVRKVRNGILIGIKYMKDKTLDWKTLLIAGVVISIAAKLLQDSMPMFSAIGVLGDIMILLGIVNWIGSLSKKK